MVRYRVRIVFLFAIIALFSGCGLFKKKIPLAAPYPDWVKKSVIYEIDIRLYSPIGTFNAIAADLPRIKDLGIDILCFMPVNLIGDADRKDAEGAKPKHEIDYPIKDYKAVNPNFGTVEDFKDLVAKAHGMGIKVMIDWVASFTAGDNSWITEHPDWYYKDNKENTLILPHSNNHNQQLDFSKKELRKAMISAMKFWVKNFDIDGFRCNMAGLVPTDFWEEARAELQKIKPLYLLAENEDKVELCKIAFDSNYGFEMHHLTGDICQGKKTASAILNLQSKLDAGMPQRAFKLNFITDPDKNSGDKVDHKKLGKAEKSCAVLTYTLPGMPLITNGQETGIAKVHRYLSKDSIYKSDTLMITFYQTLNKLKHRNPALWNPPYGGKLVPLSNADPDKIVSFLRLSGHSRVMVLINMSPDTITTLITSTIADGNYFNTFNQNKININLDNRKCYFEPWEFLVLEGEE